LSVEERGEVGSDDSCVQRWAVIRSDRRGGRARTAGPGSREAGNGRSAERKDRKIEHIIKEIKKK
jgi:hypothetical protein